MMEAAQTVAPISVKHFDINSSNRRVGLFNTKAQTRSPFDPGFKIFIPLA